VNDDGPHAETPTEATVREFKEALHGCGWHAQAAWREGNHTALVSALCAAVADGWKPDHLAKRVALGLATYPTPNAAGVLLSRLRRAAGQTDPEEGD
jgi:hypothetical protein